LESSYSPARFRLALIQFCRRRCCPRQVLFSVKSRFLGSTAGGISRGFSALCLVLADFCCGRLFVSTESPELERAGARPAKISSPLVRSAGGSLSARASVPQLARLIALFRRRGARPAKISSPLVRSAGGSLSARASVPQLARLAALFHRRGLRFSSPLRSSFLRPQFSLSRFRARAKAHWFLLI
jgi:hypothetical protein